METEIKRPRRREKNSLFHGQRRSSISLFSHSQFQSPLSLCPTRRTASSSSTPRVSPWTLWTPWRPCRPGNRRPGRRRRREVGHRPRGHRRRGCPRPRGPGGSCSFRWRRPARGLLPCGAWFRPEQEGGRVKREMGRAPEEKKKVFVAEFSLEAAKKRPTAVAPKGEKVSERGEFLSLQRKKTITAAARASRRA